MINIINNNFLMQNVFIKSDTKENIKLLITGKINK